MIGFQCDKTSNKGLSPNGRSCNGVDKRQVLNGHDVARGCNSCGALGRGKNCCPDNRRKGNPSQDKANGTAVVDKGQFGLKFTLEDMLEVSLNDTDTFLV